MAIHPKASQEIDTYVASLNGFAKPICKKLREVIRRADPEIVEDWKWGPNFNKNGMVCGFGAFKEHVTFTFFQGAAMKDPMKILAPCSADNAHNRSIKFRHADEVDEKTLAAYVKEAASLNVKGVKAPSKKRPIPMAPDLKKALAANAFFDALAPGYQRDYLEWVVQAKQPATRSMRIETTVKQCAEGKKRNWKYEK